MAYSGSTTGNSSRDESKISAGMKALKPKLKFSPD